MDLERKEKLWFYYPSEDRNGRNSSRHEAKKLESNANGCGKDIHVCAAHRTELTGIPGIHF